MNTENVLYPNKEIAFVLTGTEDELDEFLDDKEFDLVEDGEALEKNIKKGLK